MQETWILPQKETGKADSQPFNTTKFSVDRNKIELDGDTQNLAYKVEANGNFNFNTNLRVHLRPNEWAGIDRRGIHAYPGYTIYPV